MKKLIICLCLALILCGCSQGADKDVETVREQIESLPTVEEFILLSPEEQTQSYNHTQSVYEAYMALSPEQQAQIPEAEAVFEALFSWFNAQVQPLTTEATAKTVP